MTASKTPVAVLRQCGEPFHNDFLLASYDIVFSSEGSPKAKNAPGRCGYFQERQSLNAEASSQNPKILNFNSGRFMSTAHASNVSDPGSGNIIGWVLARLT